MRKTAICRPQENSVLNPTEFDVIETVTKLQIVLSAFWRLDPRSSANDSEHIFTKRFQQQATKAHTFHRAISAR